MKTKLTIIGILLIALSTIAKSQSLTFKGFIVDTSNTKINANYSLKLDNEIIKSGTKSKIKYELELNKNYTLIISKEGYVTKTILFSTFTNRKKDFYYEFDACLIKSTGSENKQSTLKMPYVYYCKTNNEFIYSFIDNSLYTINTKHK